MPEPNSSGSRGLSPWGRGNRLVTDRAIEKINTLKITGVRFLTFGEGG